MRFALLLVTLVGCYAPTAHDCSFRCSRELTCPAPLICVGTFCRDDMEPATSCTPTIDAPSMPGFCDLAPAHVYCQDFDTTQLEAQGWTPTQTADTAIALTMTAKSAPFALSTSTPASIDDTTPEDAYLMRELAGVPGTFNVLRVAVDIRFEKREAPSQPKEALQIYAGDYSLTFASNGTNENYFLVGDSLMIPTQTFDISGLATWINYEITITRSSTSLLVSVKRDGDFIPNNSTLGVPKIAPPADKSWHIRIGAWNTSTNGLSTFLFDNLLVTAE